MNRGTSTFRYLLRNRVQPTAPRSLVLSPAQSRFLLSGGIRTLTKAGWLPPVQSLQPEGAYQMTTKHIGGSYPAGYYLKPTYQTLVIDPSGVIGGPGITTTAVHPSTIDNLGSVQGTGNGITLSDGGAIRNGSATNTT